MAVTISAIAGFTLLSARAAGYRKKARKAIGELYKIQPEYNACHKIFELNKSVFGSRHKTVRKSPVLMAAEHFKSKFGVGKFVLFCSERNFLLPLMGVGYKLRVINPLKLEFLQKIVPELSHNGKYGEEFIALDNERIQQISNSANLVENTGRFFGLCYRFGNQITIFIGEDSKGELAKYCITKGFNKAVWPLLFNICKSHSNVKKQQERLKSLQAELKSAQGELSGISKKLKYKTIDMHQFYRISNRLFSIYDEKRLIESYVDAIESVLKPSKIVVLLNNRDESNSLKIYASKGLQSFDDKKMKFPVDENIFKALKTKKQAIVLPILSSGLPEENPFLEAAIPLGFSTLEKLTVGNDIKALVMIGDKPDDKPFTDSELEVFTTLTNMASLALNNIHQYRTIEKMSYTDFLTEIYNYRYFYKRLREEIFRAKRFDRMLALVIFDIDNFKTFNDTYGHQAGDEVLKNLAGLVTGSVRAIDIVSRYGGEEFCIIMPDTGFANCLIFIERLRKMIEEHKFTSKLVDEGYSISVSIGGAIYPVDAQTPDRLIYCSDMALLKSKNDGRNRSMMFNSSMLDDENLVKDSQQQLTDMGIYEDI